jgi:hypothetical protein
MATAEEYAKMSDSEKKKEDWMNNKWRPMMGWMYMLVCVTDFVLFPVLWSIIQVHGGGEVKMQWQPITLQGAGLFHIAMGAILGIAAYGRTQEKLNGANNGGLSLPTPAPAPSFSAPSTPSFSAPSTPSFSAPKPSFSAPAPSTPSFSSTGKPMPIQPEQPEL